jgi:hypothetical protein
LICRSNKESIRRHNYGSFCCSQQLKLNQCGGDWAILPSLDRAGLNVLGVFAKALTHPYLKALWMLARHDPIEAIATASLKFDP